MWRDVTIVNINSLFVVSHSQATVKVDITVLCFTVFYNLDNILIFFIVEFSIFGNFFLLSPSFFFLLTVSLVLLKYGRVLTRQYFYLTIKKRQCNVKPKIGRSTKSSSYVQKNRRNLTICLNLHHLSLYSFNKKKNCRLERVVYVYSSTYFVTLWMKRNQFTFFPICKQSTIL